MKCFENLSVTQRKILVGRVHALYGAGYTPDEIADALNHSAEDINELLEAFKSTFEAYAKRHNKVEQ